MDSSSLFECAYSRIIIIISDRANANKNRLSENTRVEREEMLLITVTSHIPPYLATKCVNVTHCHDHGYVVRESSSCLFLFRFRMDLAVADGMGEALRGV